jgi:hypothetical protein
MDGPLACVIRVRGALPPHLEDRLGGLRLTPVARPRAGAGAPRELRGELPGQAPRLGALTTLHGLGLRLLSVACTPGRPAPADGAAPAGPPTAPPGRASPAGGPAA